MRNDEVKNTIDAKNSHSHKINTDNIIPLNHKTLKINKSMELNNSTWDRVFNTVSDWILIIDLEGNILHTNKAGEKYTNIPTEKIIGQKCCKLVHGSNKHRPNCPIKTMNLTENQASSEIHLHNGKWISVKVEPIKNKDNKIESCIHIVRDITEQKRIEENLSRSDQKYNNIFTKSNDAITYLDSFGKIINVNNKVIEIFGGKKEDLINKHFTKIGLFSIKDIPNYIKLFKSVLTGKKHSATVKITNKKGETKYIENSASLIKSNDSPIRIMVISKDVTEQKLAEDVMRRSSIIIDSTTDAVITTRTDGIITSWNKGAEIIYGYNKEEVIGKPVSILYKEKDLPVLNSIISNLLKGKDIPSIEVTCIDKNHRDVEILLSLTTIKDKKGKIIELVGITKDITERKQFEKALKDNEEKYRMLFEHAGDYILVLEIPEKGIPVIRDANISALKMHGYTREELIGKPISLLESNISEKLVKERLKLLSQNDYARFNVSHKRKDGTVFEAEVSAKKIIIGSKTYSMSIERDITKRKQTEDLLRSNEAQLSNAAKIAKIGYWEYNTDKRQFIFNDQFYSIFGTNAEQVDGYTMSPERYSETFIHPDDRQHLSKEMLVVKDSPDIEFSRQLEHRIIYSDGNFGTVSVRYFVIKDEQGRPIKLQGAIQDITEHRKALELLKESEEQYKQVISTTTDAIGLFDAQTKQFIDVNKAAERLYGYSREEFLSMTRDDITAQREDSDRIAEELCKKGTINIPVRYHKKKNGQIFPVEVSGSIFKLNGRDVMCGIIRDITERQNKEQEIVDLKDFYSLILNNVHDGIWVTNEDDRLIYFNPGMEKIAGIKSKDVLGMSVIEDFPPETTEQFLDFYLKAKETHQPEQYEAEITTPAGRNTVQSGWLIPRIKDSQYEGMICTIQDITERIQAQKQIQEMEIAQRALIDSVPDSLFMIKTDGTLTVVNQGLAQNFGKSKEELIGTNTYNLVAEELADKRRKFMNIVVDTGLPVTFDDKRNGKYIENRIYPVKNQKGIITHLSILGRDITEQKKAQKALLESEEKYRHLFTEMGHGFALHELVLNKENKPLDYITIEVNQAFENILGVKKENVINKRASQFLPPDELQKWVKLFGNVVLTNTPTHYETYSPANNKYFYGYAYSIDKNHFAVIFEDITERKKNEETLRQSEEKFRNVVENAREGIYIIQNGERLYCNPRWLEIIGYSEEEYKHVPFLSRIHPEDLDYVTNIYKKLRNREELNSPFEFRILNKFNEVIFLSGKASYIQWEGKPAELVILEDISGSKEAENALLHSEQKYRLLFENMINGFALHEIVVDENNNPIDYIFIEVNVAFEKLTGLKREDILNKKITEVMPGIENDPANWINKYGQVALTGQEMRFEDYSQPLDKWYSVLTYQTRIGRFATIFEDITERKKAEKAVFEKENLLRKTQKLAKLGGWEWDIIQNKATWTDEVYNIYGVDRNFDTSDFEKMISYYNEKDRNILKEAFNRCLNNHKPFDIEVRFINAQRKQLWCRTLGTPIFKDGKLIKIRGNIIDITEKKKTELELKRSESRYRELFENTPNGVAIYEVIDGGKDFIFRNFNRAGEEIDNQSREELIGKSIFEVRPNINEFGLIEAFRKVLKTGETVHHPITLYKDERLNAWYDNLIYLLPSGELVTIFRDLTEQKQVEEELKSNEEKLRFITNSIEDVFWMSTPGIKKMIYISPSYEKIWGQSCQSLYDNPKSFLDIVYPEDRTILANIVKKYHALGKPYDCEYRILPRNGQIKWIFERGFPVHDNEGKILYMTGVCTDITSRKQIQETLHENEILLNEVGRIAKIGGWEMDLISRKSKWTQGTYDIVDINYGDPIPGPDDHLNYYLPEYRPLVENAIKNLIEKDIPLDIEAKAQTAKGKIKWFRAIGRAVRENGKCTKLFGTLQDVTEAKETEEVLNNHRRLLEEQIYLSKALLDALPCVALLLKPKTREIVASNKAAMEVGAVPGKTCFETWGRRSESCPWCMAPELWSNGEEQHKEVKHMGIVWDAYWIPVSNNLYMHFAFDITERKKIEQSIFNYQEQLKSLASQLTLTEEKERYRIATHLHDQIGQYLAVSRIKIVELLNSTISQNTENTLKLIEEWLHHAIQETRSLTYDLSSPILHELGIEKAIVAWLDDEIRKKYKITTEFHSDKLPRTLDEDIEVLLFRNIRELLFNVIKHANANKIKVSVENIDKNIRIIVEDNGTGFNLKEIADTAHSNAKFGLFSIRERLENFGGDMNIETAPGKGCKVTLMAPLNKA